MKFKISMIALATVMISGCAYIDQNLTVAPEVSVAKSNIGQGKKIALRVVDDREDQIIGFRHDGYGIKGAKITTKQDLVELIKNSVIDGLKNLGYEPVGQNDSSVVLKVDLRALSYDTAMGLWTGGNIGKSTLKVTATLPNGKIYEKSYHGQQEIRTAFVGSQETNAKVINEALSEAMIKIFEDKELWDFLNQN